MKELAELFMDQCIGSYSGHMSHIPNNPLFRSIFTALKVPDPQLQSYEARLRFINALRELATALEIPAVQGRHQ